ncbi:MAG: hypothetical protein JW940_29035 [Polyangiaceae bacterium]|nr:hypothetical protein [Polyangiaceae bacterium]
MPSEPSPRRSAFHALRVVVLVGILAIVLLYAWHDFTKRRSRLQWNRTLDIAIVMIRAGPIADAAVSAFEGHLPGLEDQLAAQLARYRTSAVKPFHFALYGPIDGEKPPFPPTDPGLVAALRHAWTAWRFRARIDRALDIPTRGYDALVYVAAVPSSDPEQRFVEGFGEHGGHVGYVVVQLDQTMIEPALFVVTHELLHTLGTEDRYDSQGRTRIPEGLVAPDQQPLFPQPCADVMGRGLLLGPTEQRLPESIDEFCIGETTARELRWVE